ncbi:hypothetical protein [Flavobacterium beibuense]|uniref:Uncharacterized protein n=1 Tax=Flavobacterium beibuense TaxID=657326 RepID=A0A444WDI6_9FLAO|nr:hypothetical protein [Flavobacterium beibuense]RYJ43898.1 hypothetical protein NU09_1406 [Flavobacterium beibuense]
MKDDEIKKISDEEVEKLYDFTKKHFVYYYDLQVELVDHLANAIEEKWGEQPQLSFDDVLKAEFKKFGIFGFTGIVEKRQLALQKKYNKILWGYFKEFFKLPKIMLTLALILFLVKAMQYIHPITGGVLALAILLFSIVRFFVLNRQYNKKVKKTGRRWMLEETIFRCGGISFIVFIPYNFIQSLFKDEYTVTAQWIMATAIVLFALYEYIILYVIISKAEKLLNDTYPEYAVLKHN